MLMNGALFALLEAAFLVFPAWRTRQLRGAHARRRLDPHNPGADAVGWRGDHRPLDC